MRDDIKLRLIFSRPLFLPHPLSLYLSLNFSLSLSLLLAAAHSEHLSFSLGWPRGPHAAG
jgi:hypothetical protein